MTLAIIYAFNIIASAVIIFVERKNPSATLLWLLILFLLPGVGLFLYIALSQVFVRFRFENLSSSLIMKDNPSLVRQVREMEESSFGYSNEQAQNWNQLIHFNQEYASAFLTQDNDVELFTHGSKSFERMFSDLKAAEKSINMEYFIIKPDKVGLELLDILTERAAAGVKVRLIVDAMGGRKMRKKHFEALKAAGGEMEYFFPGKIIKSAGGVNFRNHRKITVIDSRIAYIGGLNAAEEYVGVTSRFGDWRDTHLRVTGSALFDIDARFILDWNFAHRCSETVYPKDYIPEKGGSIPMQVISCGPESPESEIKFLYLKMINGAKKSVFIQTPYLVPDTSVYEAIKGAALSGVDVNIMIPSQPDHPFVYWVTYQTVGSLLAYGVKVYIYNKGFLHSKTLVVDGEVASVGSANFDIRSFELNFECNAVIYDADFCGKCAEAFNRDIENSTVLTLEDYSARGKIIKAKESVSRLLSDIL